MNARIMFGAVMAAAALSAGMGSATADDGNGLKIGRAKPSAPLVGTWQVRVTPYNCVTGVPVSTVVRLRLDADVQRRRDVPRDDVEPELPGRAAQPGLRLLGADGP